MARVQFGELRSIKLRIFVTIENNEINKKCSYLCEILLDLRKKWDLRCIMKFICRPAIVDVCDIYLVEYTWKKKKKERKRILEFWSQHWNIRDVLHGISKACLMRVSFLYMNSALCCLLSEFRFSLYWAFYIHDSQFVLVCFIYINIS